MFFCVISFYFNRANANVDVNVNTVIVNYNKESGASLVYSPFSQRLDVYILRIF